MAHQRAAGDGLVQLWEWAGIRRAALLHDNTVDAAERTFLKDALASGFAAEPGVRAQYQQLALFGEQPIAGQMAELRRRKERERWFNEDYLQHAKPILLA